MINFVTTRSHRYTVRRLVRDLGRRKCRQWTYEDLFTRRRLPGGTWIFTDHERLSDFELSLAAAIAARLERAGSLVLNHPAHVRGRLALLKLLNTEGINDFTAWPCDGSPRPARFPVFIRNTFDHKSAAIELIGDQAGLDACILAMQRDGVSLAGKIVIEYAGEEVSPGVWARFSTYRAGDTLVEHHAAVGFEWIVKDQKHESRLHEHPGYRGFLEAERDFVANGRFRAVLRRAFDLARVDYGRADFAIVAGRPQIYEINTNPKHGSRRALLRRTHPDRLETQLGAEDRLRAALLAADGSGTGTVLLDDPLLRRQQKPLRRLLGPARG
jgi:hypothetical protein